MKALILCILINVLISSKNSGSAEACAATAPITNPTTEAPAELNSCDPATLSLGTGDNMTPQQSIDVTRSGFTSTQIGTTQDTLSTMMVSCTAANGFFASMETDESGVLENEVMPLPSTVTIKVTCSSVDMKWFYETVFNGEPFRREITDEVTCLQAPRATEPVELNKCDPAALTLVPGDNNTPQQNIEVTSEGFTSTQIGTTQDSISTMMVSCTADAMFQASMQLGTFDPVENEVMPPPQSVEVKVTCSSVDMKWLYEAVVNGQTQTREITGPISCLQVALATEPVELNKCAPPTLTLVPGDNNTPQQNIDVTAGGITSTQIGTTQDSISTMMVSCTADDGFQASMMVDDFDPRENGAMPPPQTVTVKLTCSSVDMIWNYETVINGQPDKRAIAGEISCLQVSLIELKKCDPADLTIVQGDNNTPQQYIDITSEGFTSTQIGTTEDTISKMMLTCTTTIPGFSASMETDNAGVQENGGMPPPQTVTIQVACSSVDMQWYYETIFMGAPFTRVINNDVSCQQGMPMAPPG